MALLQTWKVVKTRLYLGAWVNGLHVKNVRFSLILTSMGLYLTLLWKLRSYFSCEWI